MLALQTSTERGIFMYRKILILILTLSLLFLVLSILPVHGENDIYDNVVRLHVLANSDSEEDQALKLKVRDAILAESGELFEHCATKEEAVCAIKQNMERIQRIAEKTVKDEGYDYPIEIKLGEEEYPTRVYESMAFPAGSYLSLRVLIGEGEGQNWWCVLFPPLCLSAASTSQQVHAEDAFISVGLTEDQYKIITETDKPTYTVRFKVLEVIRKWFK